MNVMTKKQQQQQQFPFVIFFFFLKQNIEFNKGKLTELHWTFYLIIIPTQNARKFV